MAVKLMTQTVTEREWVEIARRLKASPQQGQIMRLIVVDDLTNEGIAWRLGIKPRSVETQLERLYAKLDVQSRVQLAVMACSEIVRMRA